MLTPKLGGLRIAGCPFPPAWSQVRLQNLIVDETRRLQCAGMNRHEAEDARALRERTSDPLGLESCAATARDTAKRRQRIGGVGIQLRKLSIRTPTPL
jgi:hypothetical protein